MADLERGRRLAAAATHVIAAARQLDAHQMEATEGCSVVLTEHLAELSDALRDFQREVEAR